jgi:hypothetical protein
LLCKTTKAVIIALELESVQYAVYERKVDSVTTPANGEFVNNCGVGISQLLLLKTGS